MTRRDDKFQTPSSAQTVACLDSGQIFLLAPILPSIKVATAVGSAFRASTETAWNNTTATNRPSTPHLLAQSKQRRIPMSLPFSPLQTPDKGHMELCELWFYGQCPQRGPSLSDMRPCGIHTHPASGKCKRTHLCNCVGAPFHCWRADLGGLRKGKADDQNGPCIPRPLHHRISNPNPHPPPTTTRYNANGVNLSRHLSPSGRADMS